MFVPSAYVSIVGSDDVGWRVLRVPATAGPDSLPEYMGPRCRDYATAVAQAGDVARILGIPRILPTFCPVCNDTAEWCAVLAGGPVDADHAIPGISRGEAWVSTYPRGSAAS